MRNPNNIEFIWPYGVVIFSLIPDIVHKMSLLDWERTLEAIIDHAIAYRKSESSDLVYSVERILTSLNNMNRELNPYSVD